MERLIELWIGFQAFAIMPNITAKESQAILNRLGDKSRVVFIDLAPSGAMLDFVSLLVKAGHPVAGYFDHHLDSRNQLEIRNMEKLRGIITGSVRVVSRKEASSCAVMVEKSEWKKLSADVVFFRADPDGFLAVLKGAGIHYPELENDAAIFEGRTGTQSFFGKLLGDAEKNLPPAFSQNPVGYRETKQRIYQTLVNHLASDGGVPIDEFEEEVKAAVEAAENLATEIANRAEVKPGKVVFADCLPQILAGRNINFSTLKAEVLRRHGAVLVCTTGMGHLGKMVFIELPKEWGYRIDLRDFLPRGIGANVPGRIQVPLVLFSEFLELWRKKFPKGPK